MMFKSSMLVWMKLGQCIDFDSNEQDNFKGLNNLCYLGSVTLFSAVLVDEPVNSLIWSEGDLKFK